MSLCRLCSKYAPSGKESLQIFAKRNQKVLENIKTLTGIVLKNFMGLPELICEVCDTEIKRMMHFRDNCIQAQIHLMEGLSTELVELIPESYRIDLLHASPLSEHYSVIESLEEQESNILVEENSEDRAAGLIVEDSKSDEQEFQTEFDNVKLEESDLVNAEELVYQSEEELEFINGEIAQELNSVESKQRVGRPNISKLVFICEECGNHISGRKAFDLHCRRHRGDKQFECEICQKAFCTTSEVKRHMRKHTGERPFGCKYCGRCFTDYSTRRNHERTHTNERPHICRDCGKAFTTAYILKNHMLVHSGKRDFHCNLCDKYFLRDTHLSTHYRSHMHKRNLERQKAGSDTYNESS